MLAGRHTIRVIAPLALFVAALPGVLHGGVLTWSTLDGTGIGNWDKTTRNWRSGLASVAWVDGSDAVFGGPGSQPAGTVTVTVPVTAHSMSFNGDGYVVLASTPTARNVITLGGSASPYVSVNSAGGGGGGSGSATAYVGAILGGSSGLLKQGDGTLELNVSNTYTGATTVTQGVLRLAESGALPGGTGAVGGTSNLAINGGVVELAAGDFTRGAGALSHQVQWTGAGGFAALYMDRTVNLGAASAMLTWGSGGFVPSGQALKFGTVNSDSIVDFQNPIDLGGSVRTIQGAGPSGLVAARLSGGLSGSGGGVAFTGSGGLELAGSNSYTGVTSVSGIVLRLSSTAALPGGIGASGGLGGLTLSGGIIDLAAGDFLRSTGTAAGQVQWNGSGGFSASGNDRVVNLGGTSQTVAWGSGGFVPPSTPLALGSALGDATVDFQNPINLSGGIRTVLAGAGYAVVDGRLSGSLSNGGLSVTGSGTLELSASNAYSQATQLNGGALRLSHSAALPGGIGVAGVGSFQSNLVFNGGVLELAANDFSRGLGSSGAQVRWNGSGGFSAAGGVRAVNLGGTGAQLTWGSTSGFVSASQSLIFGSTSADALLDFQNPISLGSVSAGTIQVVSGSAPVDARLSGSVTGSSSGLVIGGDGTLELSASNAYSGATRLLGGVLRLSHSAALPAASNLQFAGGQLELASGDFTRGLGTGASQVQWLGDGGFSAAGGTRAVNIGGGYATMIWGSLSFVPGGSALLLGAKSNTDLVDFQNPLNLSTVGGLVQVGNGGAVIDARISRTISDSFGDATGFNVSGLGTLELTASNVYVGPTVLHSGVLRLSHSAALPGGTGPTGGQSNLVFNGGVVELAAGDFSRPLGSGGSQVQWTDGGGFSAAGGTRRVNLGGAGAEVTWGNGYFVPTNSSLLLGSQSDNALLEFQNPINLAGDSRNIHVNGGAAAVDARLIGPVGGQGNLSFSGNGRLDLAAENTFAGTTSVVGVVLRLSHTGALPGGNRVAQGRGGLYVVGGVLELAADDFGRELGQGAGEVEFGGAGGFAAVGGMRIVNFGGLGAPAAWGSGSFLPLGAALLLGTSCATDLVEIQNPIDLGGSPETIQVTAGSAPLVGRLARTISGSGGLTVAGNGTLDLAAANTYHGSTTVSGAVLRLSHSAALPGGAGASGGLGNLILAGGIIELNAGSFTRGLGAGPSQVQWSGSGGFSAAGATRTVNLGGASAPLTWGSGGFVASGAALLLGSSSATALVDFQNPIQLTAGGGTVHVTRGSTALVGRLSGALTGVSLTVVGGATLDMAGANAYSGPTTVINSVVRLSSSAALPGGIGSAGGASNLVLDGGVVELNFDNFARGTGTSATQVQWLGSGGFSAAGATRSVNLGDSSTQVAWGSGFVPVGKALILGSASATALLDFQNPIALSNSSGSVQTVAGPAVLVGRLSGALSGSGKLTVLGNGTLELVGTNTYTGGTTVAGGALRLSSSAALPGGIGAAGGLGNLAFQGGVVELNFGNFARGTGTAATQVQWLGSGGFSAAGSARTVNLGGSSGTLIWGSGGFVPIGSEFLLGSASDTATIDFQNPIDFGATLNTVRVTHGTAAVDARLSGRLNGGGGLTLAGNGTLELTGSNTYTGATTVGGGTLRLAGTSALPGGAGTSGGLSNLVFAGGIVELSAGDFARGAGTAGSQVQWLGSGGFSAVGGSRVVNLGGSSGTLAWGSGGFVPNGSALILGSAGDTAAVDFQNPIDLGAGIRTVQVNRGSSPVDAILSGRLGGSGGLMKTGDGALVLSGSNAFTGGLTVTGGIVDITVSGALPDGGSLIVVSSSTHFPTFFSPVVGGPEAPVAAPAAVPEPCTPMLLACGGLLIAAALRRAAVKNTRESKRGRRNRNGDAGSIDRRRCGG